MSEFRVLRTAPLSPPQRLIQMLEMANPGSYTGQGNVLRSVFGLGGPLDVERLSRAWAEVVEGHEVFWTALDFDDIDNGQRVCSPSPTEDHMVVVTQPEPLWKIPLSKLPTYTAGELPLARALLVEHDAQRHTLVVALHHVSGDPWSMRLLLQELATRYSGSGDVTTPLQYADIQWSRSTTERSLSFWQKQLDGLKVLRIPLIQPKDFSLEGIPMRTRIQTEAGVGATMDQVARASKATPFTVALAAWARSVSQCANQENFVIPTMVPYRDTKSLQRCIGFFLNPISLRMQVTPGASMGSLLVMTRKVLLSGLAHASLPIQVLIEEDPRYLDQILDPVAVLSMFQTVEQPSAGNLPLAGVAITQLSEGAGTNLPRELFLEDIEWTPAETEPLPVDLDVTLLRDPSSKAVWLDFTYNGRLLAEETIDQLATGWQEAMGDLRTSS